MGQGAQIMGRQEEGGLDQWLHQRRMASSAETKGVTGEAVSLEENEEGRAPVELTEAVVLATLIAAPSVEVQSNRFKIFSNIL